MPETPDAIGAGRYEVRGVLGAGGMATVYRTWDRRLRVERAVKVLHPAMVDKANIRRRFETEASTMARIQHPNIASVFDVSDHDGGLFMVMELIAGGSLADLVTRQGVLTARQAAETFACVCDALPAPPRSVTPVAGKVATKPSPAAAVAATPAPALVPAPPSVVAEVASLPASFKASGDADAVFLVAGGKRYSPGDLPAGTYTIEASFGGQAPTAAGSITLSAGQTATVKCNGSFMKCR